MVGKVLDLISEAVAIDKKSIYIVENQIEIFRKLMESSEDRARFEELLILDE